MVLCQGSPGRLPLCRRPNGGSLAEAYQASNLSLVLVIS